MKRRIQLENPHEYRERRDREIARAYVALKESKTAVAEIVATLGVNYRTVYRAIKIQGDWARAEASSKVEGSADTVAPHQATKDAEASTPNPTARRTA